MARVVVAGVPHHVTQRGNRRQRTFFAEADFKLYRHLLGTWCRQLKVEIWAYCLMPNHVHLILRPTTEKGLAQAIGEAHRRYSLAINRREGWTGYLWQGRFASCPMDETHVLRAARYLLLNPVTAGLALRAEDWPNSSAATHLYGATDPLVNPHPLASRVPDWARFLACGFDSEEGEEIERHQRTGRPLGAPDFVTALEGITGRALQPRKRGPQPRAASCQ